MQIIPLSLTRKGGKENPGEIFSPSIYADSESAVQCLWARKPRPYSTRNKDVGARSPDPVVGWARKPRPYSTRNKDVGARSPDPPR
jgi:hypothetical protein